MHLVFHYCFPSPKFHHACLVADTQSGPALRANGDLSSFHRTRGDQQSHQKHREARSAQTEGVDISTLPDNMTHIVVRCEKTEQNFSIFLCKLKVMIQKHC